MDSILKKRITVDHNKTCEWCGNNKVSKLKRNFYLYQFGVNDDWRGDIWEKQLFCSSDCRKIYFNM
jgi:hypothetical protein